MPDSHSSVVAAIDIGSSAIRLDVAEVRPDATLHLIDSLKRGVQLGKDAFTSGHLSEESVRASCEVLRDFKQVMDTYGVTRYRAVATSAVRESSNSETFLDRILMSTGLDVEIIDGSEENRLTHSAVTESLRNSPEISMGKTLLAEVGGGSTDLTLLSGGEPLQSGTYPLGSIRLRAEACSGASGHEQRVRLLKRQITNLLSTVRRAVDLKDAVHLVALGGDVRFAARAILQMGSVKGSAVLPRQAFFDFVDSIARHPVDRLVRKFSLSYMDAETLVPALLTYMLVMKETQAEEVVVSDASIRAGMLLDFLPAEPGKKLEKLTHQILSAARALGRKYQYDEDHAENVRELSEVLFDALRREHRLSDTHRLYLQVAALLHDIGLFVSTRAHHKHSQYLISASDLFGLRQRELEIIANVARYHRRALPQRNHPLYVQLDREERMVVSKLAAILRVANSLDKEHTKKVRRMTVSLEGDRITLTCHGSLDLTMEKAALAGRSELFADVFGKQIILRESPDKP